MRRVPKKLMRKERWLNRLATTGKLASHIVERKRKPIYLPTEEEIAAACDEIRSKWVDGVQPDTSEEDDSVYALIHRAS